MSNEVQCENTAAYIASGLGASPVRVCVDCAEKYVSICEFMGFPANLDPDVPESWQCQQMKRLESTP